MGENFNIETMSSDEIRNTLRRLVAERDEYKQKWCDATTENGSLQRQLRIYRSNSTKYRA